MKLRCVAIDDEPIALEIIKCFASRLDDIEINTFTDPLEGISFINRNGPDIVFLDIELNDYNGIQVAKHLDKEICIIFTTAFTQYAVEGFNLDVVDFLHKPFSFERFKDALSRAKRRLGYKIKPGNEARILIKQDYSNVPVAIGEIRYVEAMENYSKIFMKESKLIIAHNSLKNISDKLPAEQFIRIHKSFIVPISEIKSFTRQNITLSDGTLLPVGRQFAPALIQRMT